LYLLDNETQDKALYMRGWDGSEKLFEASSGQFGKGLPSQATASKPGRIPEWYAVLRTIISLVETERKGGGVNISPHALSVHCQK